MQLDIPDAIWADARERTSATLPGAWDAKPAGRASIAFGSAWIHASSSALLVVPSVIVPEEFNVLINPQHPGSAQISAAKLRRWLYDPRLARSV